MSGGMPSRAMSSAFSAPPAPRRPAGATAAAAGIGSPQSRHAAPNTTAASPIIAPTDRSMPPVMMTGVSAMASRPSSTLRRVISKKLPTVAKFGATRARRARSRRPAPTSRIDSPLRNRASRRRHAARRDRLRPRRARAADRRSASIATAARMMAPWIARSQYALTPRNVSAGPIAPSRTTPSTVPAMRAAPAGDRGAADDDGGDDLHLEAEAGVARNLVEADRVEQRGEAGQRRRRARTRRTVTNAVSSPASRAASRFDPVA